MHSKEEYMQCMLQPLVCANLIGGKKFLEVVTFDEHYLQIKEGLLQENVQQKY
jgi:hypothetical protein